MVLAEGDLQAKATREDRKRLRGHVKAGTTGFGTMDQHIFQQAVQHRLSTELPQVLDDFEFKEGKIFLGKGCEALLAYVEDCFVAYEAEIARLNACIRKLKKENLKLKDGEHIGAAAAVTSGGKSASLPEWRERTLRRQSQAFTVAIREQSGGCDLKAIALAREILRRLDNNDVGW